MFKSKFKALRRGAFALTVSLTAIAGGASAEILEVEKDELKFGFIKLTDMAPLAIAYEKGYFEDEDLFVTLEPQANWKVLLDRVITGELDGAPAWSSASIVRHSASARKADPMKMH